MFVMQSNKFNLANSVNQLRIIDTDLERLFDFYQVNDLKPEKNYLKSLTRSIVYQQLSSNAAKTIFKRFTSVFPRNSFPKPNDILNTDIKKIRSSGISYNKSCYIKNIATAFLDEPDIYNNFEKMSDDDVINTLVKVKGIGLWTAQMFLMFTLNRPDVFPATDLAMQKGYQSYFGLNERPKPNLLMKKSEAWIPYRTTVSLYLWSVLEGPFDW